jgi:cobalt/nickel transport system ATP-binding protein
MHILETKALTYQYRNGIRALDSVDFIAPRKCRIAVLGPNGAGKSTLFKHFNGVLKPLSGEVRVAGELVTSHNLREIRKTVGLVFQNPDDQIFSPTVEEDVAFGPVNLGLDDDTVAHRVASALRLLEIEHLAARAPHQLSGGEKKRVAIAGVIAMEPQVLVLDEPSSGLDPRGVSELLRFLNSLPDQYGMTVIFATHHVDLVPELADYVYVMDQGRILASGTPAEIFTHEELLEQTRLEVPILRRLVRSLQDQGIDIETGYTFEEVQASLLSLLRRIP